MFRAVQSGSRRVRVQGSGFRVEGLGFMVDPSVVQVVDDC